MIRLVIAGSCSVVAVFTWAICRAAAEGDRAADRANEQAARTAQVTEAADAWEHEHHRNSR